MKSIKEIRTLIERQKGKQQQLQASIETEIVEIRRESRDLKRHEQAKEIVREISIKMQENLQYSIGSITSLALEAVFNNPYTLEVEFVQRRNKTECDLFFSRGDMRIDPLTASGGGALDVAAFALRVASWSMQHPRTDNVLILDEPFKHLKTEEANQRVLEMIKTISEKLNLQIICVSDERIDRSITEQYADKLFEVSIRKGISKVKVI